MNSLSENSRPLLKELSPRPRRLERRLFLKQGPSISALSLLTGCDLKDDDAIDRLLWAASRWNDRVQAALFNPNKLAPTFGDAHLTTPFPFNAFYEEALAPVIDAADYKLELVRSDREQARLDARTAARPAPTTQIMRLVCVEGWSAIGKWGGFLFADFQQRIAPISPRVTSASAAPTNIRRASTCPRPCTHRHCSRLTFQVVLTRPNMAIQSS